MIGKKRTYGTLDLSDQYQRDRQRAVWSSIALQNIDYAIDGRTDFDHNENWPGTRSSPTLPSGRFFNMSAIISGISKIKRWEAREELNRHICFRYGPDEYRRLERETDHGHRRWCMAKVTKMAKPSNGLADPQIRCHWQLFSQEGVFFGERRTAKGWLWSVGWIGLATALPTGSVSAIGWITVENKGNANTYCTIQVVGECVNPKIINITNQSKLRLKGTTTNLIVENKNGIQTITDNGTNIKNRRLNGTEIVLSPGQNNIVVISDTYSTDVQVTISRYDAFTA